MANIRFRGLVLSSAFWIVVNWPRDIAKGVIYEGGFPFRYARWSYGELEYWNSWTFLVDCSLGLFLCLGRRIATSGISRRRAKEKWRLVLRPLRVRDVTMECQQFADRETCCRRCGAADGRAGIADAKWTVAAWRSKSNPIHQVKFSP